VFPYLGQLPAGAGGDEADSGFERGGFAFAVVDVEHAAVVFAGEHVEDLEGEGAGMGGDRRERGEHVLAAGVGAGGGLGAAGAVPRDVGVQSAAAASMLAF
jgi:hypothetical protein